MKKKIISLTVSSMLYIFIISSHTYCYSSDIADNMTKDHISTDDHTPYIFSRDSHIEISVNSNEALYLTLGVLDSDNQLVEGYHYIKRAIFKLNTDNCLVSLNGYMLMGTRLTLPSDSNSLKLEPIILPAIEKNISIDSDGIINDLYKVAIHYLPQLRRHNDKNKKGL